ncbi:TGF-beta-activated kinase 1 and MAP3K7-binding protein 1-like [Phymastichus coffea]|uniref:TGF-beta-activated kinase 1 and MAP3K7-binding protein 1-like n=1 Tax=Phymastichus coffea TaxID=108790 RepID=UPI00273C8FE9|nr:TGF-beta-activated kinase 1 and MAP3K7-binding protein 1-like [Phymastichus coffea]
MFFQDTQRGWTDDLPVCKQSGIGQSTNQTYREGGFRQEEHTFEDKSFHCKYDDSTFLYAVFDGHQGSKAATFAMQRMAAEILLGQLNGKGSDEEVKDVLRQAFITVERGYMDSIGDLLAERASLQFDIPEGLNCYLPGAYQNFPNLEEKFKWLNFELSSGTSAVVALIYNNKLYVANVGDSRALLCKTDSNQVLRVVQLSIDHDLNNEDELFRLSQLGLEVMAIKEGGHLGNQENTRCLGNYSVKGGYKEFKELFAAISEPIIAEPEIHGGIELDESCRFLLLMSKGLYRSLEATTGTDQINKNLASMIVEEFRIQSTLTSVAQAVVDKIVRLHHDEFMRNSNNSSTNGKHDDITLLIRNFNYPLPNALKSPTVPPLINFNQIEHTMSTTTENVVSTTDNTSTSDTEMDDTRPTKNVNKKIQSYCDFSEFYEKFEKKKREGTLPKLPDGFEW